MRRTTHQLIYNQQSINFQLAPPASIPQFAKSNNTIPPNLSNQGQLTENSQTPLINQIPSTKTPVSNYASIGAAPLGAPLFNNKNKQMNRTSPSNTMLVDNDYVIVNP